MDRERELIVACLPRLRRYARALLGNPADADDLVQDTVERGLAKLAWWRPDGDMRAWLFGIMHNLHMDRMRASTVRFATLDDDMPLPENQTESCDGVQAMDIASALSCLAPEQREVLLLVVLEGMRYDEVAASLRIPQGTVMSRLARAREKLRQALAGDHAPGRLKVVK